MASATAAAAARAVSRIVACRHSAGRTFAATSGCAEPVAVPVEMFESAIAEQPWQPVVQAGQRAEPTSELRLNLHA